MRGWENVPLAAATSVFTDGDWIESKDQAPEGIRLLQTGNIGEGEFKDRPNKARFIDSRTFDRLNCTEVLPGDCLISRLPDPVGRACIVPEAASKMITAVDCTIVRFRTDLLMSDFFRYYSLTDGYLGDVNQACTGATRKRISRKNLGKVQIPLPPIPEQRRIVALLDEAFEGIDRAIANTEKNLANARELFESHLNRVFTEKGDGWVERKLGAAFLTATGTTPPKREAAYYGGNIPFVKPPELNDRVIDTTSDCLTPKGATVARMLPERCVLVSCIGNLGKTGLNVVPVAFNQQINAILPDTSLAVPEFIFFQMQAPFIKEQLERLAGGTTVPIVNKSKFNSLSIWLPALAQQKELVVRAANLRESAYSLESIYTRKLAALAELKQSILRKAFSGELTAPFQTSEVFDEIA